jgi:hypothetical protein
LLIRALIPLRVRLPQGEIRLEPGTPMDIPEIQARKLLDRAKGKVRPVLTRAYHGEDLTVGEMVEWDSPLFGLLRALILEDKGEYVMVQHPLTNRQAVVPKRWLTKIVADFIDEPANDAEQEV